MTILEEQLNFYKNNRAGCTFASVIAQNPLKYKWRHFILNKVNLSKIDEIIIKSIENHDIAMISLIFPKVISKFELVDLIKVLLTSNNIVLEQETIQNQQKCLGLRVKVFDNLSWVTGFGNFTFLPNTRQTPYTEIVFRVSERPNYEQYMKKPMKGALHLADLDLNGISTNNFRKLWKSTVENTKKTLGHTPNLHNAAKTTYSIPANLI